MIDTQSGKLNVTRTQLAARRTWHSDCRIIRHTSRLALCVAGFLLLGGGNMDAQVGTVTRFVEVDSDSGGFGGVLQFNAFFGGAVTSLGDLDGDGFPEFAIGAARPSVSSTPGAVWILSMNLDGTVRSEFEVTEGQAGFGGALGTTADFGAAVAAAGDLNGDGNPDLVVGAPNTLFGATNRVGAVWVLFLDSAGAVTAEQQISAGVGGFVGPLMNGDDWGMTVENLGDIDGDGTIDIAVGAPESDDFGLSEGAIWILFLTPQGTVKSELKIAEGQGGFSGGLQAFSRFGTGLANLGDLDGNGVNDLAVGAANHGSGGTVWVLYLDVDGSVISSQEIREGLGGFGGTIAVGDSFGTTLEVLPDLDGNGVVDLAVGTPGLIGGGGVWILFLAADGTVGDELLLSNGSGIFVNGTLGPAFGHGLAEVGDLDGDGNVEFVVGAPRRNDPIAPTGGGFWVLSMCDSDLVAEFDAVPTGGLNPLVVAFQDLSTGTGGFNWNWDFGDGASSSLQDPVHTYKLPGTYSVQLTLQGADGSCGNTKVDLVVVDPSPASATSRNGSGVNPDIYSTAALPLLGTTWSATVNAGSVQATGLSILIAYDGALLGLPTTSGELLLDPRSQFVEVDFEVVVLGVAQHDIEIPNDLSLEGFPVYTQVLLNGVGQLTNALDLVLGF